MNKGSKIEFDVQLPENQVLTLRYVRDVAWGFEEQLPAHIRKNAADNPGHLLQAVDTCRRDPNEGRAKPQEMLGRLRKLGRFADKLSAQESETSNDNYRGSAAPADSMPRTSLRRKSTSAAATQIKYNGNI